MPGVRRRQRQKCMREGWGGAMYTEDFKRLCHAAGFADPRVVAGHAIEVRVGPFPNPGTV